MLPDDTGRRPMPVAERWADGTTGNGGFEDPRRRKPALPKSGSPVEAVVQVLGTARPYDLEADERVDPGLGRTSGMIGEAVERTMTCIAADVDGAPAPEWVGTRTAEREARFAFRSDAAKWARDQLGEGYTPEQPIALATYLYHGPTDSPANCWVVRARKEL